MNEITIHRTQTNCTATGNSGHSLNQACAIIHSHCKESPKRPHSAFLSSKTCLNFANVGSKEALALQLQPCKPAPLQRLNF